jgi:hypothetical protein
MDDKSEKNNLDDTGSLRKKSLKRNTLTPPPPFNTVGPQYLMYLISQKGIKCSSESFGFSRSFKKHFVMRHELFP